MSDWSTACHGVVDCTLAICCEKCEAPTYRVKRCRYKTPSFQSGRTTCQPVIGRMTHLSPRGWSYVGTRDPPVLKASSCSYGEKRDGCLLVYSSRPWFFCPLGTDFTIFLVNECAVVTGEDRWALNWFIITQSKAGPLYDFRKVLASLRLDYILIQEVRKKKIWILEASPSLCSK